MELKDVVSIGGKPGLHQVVGRRTNGLIVESIDERKKRTPTSLTQKVSILEDISIYTYESDVKLRDVFKSLDTLVTGGLELVKRKMAAMRLEISLEKCFQNLMRTKYTRRIF